MSMTDPIADMLTRIRNANLRRHEAVDIPFSKLKFGLAKILEKEGYVRGVKKTQKSGFENIQIQLKYIGQEQQQVISGLRRVSRPGLRHYVGKEQIPWVRRGVGVAVLSTSKGLLTDKDSRKSQIGGEVLCHIW
ncbi:MAG TPA: 30S ribosomal protein S8 [Nitrospiria bacterium]|jgi:small subunit ribosomal protein S8